MNVSQAVVNYTAVINDTLGVFEFPEPYKTIRDVINWAIIGLVLMSVTGNTLIMIVMCREQNRTSSTSVLFTALAISDLFISISVSFERWLHWTFKVNIYGINHILTKAKTIFNYSNIQISSCLLACITLERVISIALPHKIKLICTKTKILVLLTCIVVFSINTFGFIFVVDNL